MTTLLDVLISVVFGGAITLASRGQLRVSSRPWYATRYFAATATFYGLLVMPAAAYRYFFYPDWSTMYLMEASRATVLFGVGGLLAVAIVGIMTFWLGSSCARSQKEWLMLTVMALAVSAMVVVTTLGMARMQLVGSFAQWHNSYGLRPLIETDLLPSVLVMGGCVIVGWITIIIAFAREGASFIRTSR